MAAPKDYYAELELPRDADPEDIRKQYRKLALQHHPDRNAGKENEAVIRFQKIQEAHEVLSDPVAKAKYDATLGKSRYPGASGVRGNPWANAGDHFPPPPRRTAGSGSGAQRWQTRFSNGVPPTAKQTFGSDPNAKKNAAKAFENMRKNARAEPRPSEPPPPPPRQPPKTESARQRQEASFGSRKQGYYPNSTTSGDEPPASNASYTSTRRDVPPRPTRRPVPTPMPDPLSQFREKGSSSDSHQDDKQRSSSVPRRPTQGEPDEHPRVSTDGEQHSRSADEGPGAHTDTSSKSRADAQSYGGRVEQSAQPSMGDKSSNNKGEPSIFSLPLDEDTFAEAPKTAAEHAFAKTSFDDINTSFVMEGNSNTYQFNAGTGEGDANVGKTSSPRSRRAHRSAMKHSTMHRHDSANNTLDTTQAESGFDPEGWSDKFNAQTFVPPPQPGPTGSPTRASRNNSRKTKLRQTAGTAAAVVEESSSEEEAYEWRGRNAQAQGRASATDSPQAMDIDTPVSSSSGAAATQPARNIPVEPSRPEWRAGKVDGVVVNDEKPERPAKIPLDANAVGSEDSEEFRASFADLRNVAPFSRQNEGLGSFDGMKDNLPFESKASEVPPVRVPKTASLEFPVAPPAPRLPPTVAIEGIKPNTASWVKYVSDFESYLRQWDSFNGLVVDHFATRKAHVQETRATKGYGFLGARGDGELLEYYIWIQQDNDVRRRWNEACGEHEERMREFMAFREKMKTSHT